MTERRDLEASLAAMDRKLRELQQELAALSQSEASGEAAPPPPVSPIEEAAARVAELGRRIDELVALRADLDAATSELLEEHRGAMDRDAR